MYWLILWLFLAFWGNNRSYETIYTKTASSTSCSNFSFMNGTTVFRHRARRFRERSDHSRKNSKLFPEWRYTFFFSNILNFLYSGPKLREKKERRGNCNINHSDEHSPAPRTMVTSSIHLKLMSMKTENVWFVSIRLNLWSILCVSICLTMAVQMIPVCTNS